jgi:O-Antigen ligase
MNSSSRKNKSSNRKKDSSGSRVPETNSTKTNATKTNDRSFPFLFSTLVASLFLIQFLIMTESVELGNRLWVPLLWIGLTVFAAFFYSRDILNLFKKNGTGRISDLFVLLLVGGHVISALYLFSQQGNQRASFNVMWEWVGLGASWVLFRIFLNSDQTWNFTRILFISSVSSLALLGLHQHYISFPQSVREYEQLRSQLDQLDPQNPSTAEQYHKTVLALSQMGAPLEQPARRMWEDRLTGSTEPLGFFALANSFAAVLLIGFFLCFQGFLDQYRKNKTGWIFLALSLLILFCLILTKSRTAAVGLMSGLIVWAILSKEFYSKAISLKKMMIGIGGILILLISLFTVAQFTGGFDREVISQASKSFEYRLQFWQGTWKALKDSPIWGTGPGNFRQHYLEYKLPESSEEIGDPHNLFLDVWANGGMISLIGLLGISGFVLFWFFKRFFSKEQISNSNNKVNSSQNSAIEFSSFRLFIVVFSFHLFAFSILFFLQTIMDPRILMVGLLSGSIACLIRSHFITLSVSRPVILAGICAILIHLLGAGGIEMPAIIGIILLLFNFYQIDNDHPAPSEPSKNMLLISGLGLLFILAVMTGFLPVMNSSRLLEAGDNEIQYRNNFRKAEKMYREASNQDPLSPAPFNRLSQLYYRQWIQNNKKSVELIDKSIQSLKTAIEKNRLDSKGYHLAGIRYRERFETSNSIEDLNNSVEYLEKAVLRYPTEIQILVDLVRTYQLDKDQEMHNKSRKYATKALNLDKINHQEGHVDKYLTKEIKKFLSQIN